MLFSIKKCSHITENHTFILLPSSEILCDKNNFKYSHTLILPVPPYSRTDRYYVSCLRDDCVHHLCIKVVDVIKLALKRLAVHNVTSVATTYKKEINLNEHDLLIYRSMKSPICLTNHISSWVIYIHINI